MIVDKMIIGKMTVDIIAEDKTTLSKMIIDNFTLVEMISGTIAVDEMTYR